MSSFVKVVCKVLSFVCHAVSDCFAFLAKKLDDVVAHIDTSAA